MLRAALLTADPALWSSVSASVQEHRGCIIDLGTLGPTLAGRSSMLDCDALIVDLRAPESEMVWPLLRARRDLATLALHGARQDVPPPAAVGPSAQRDLTFAPAEAAGTPKAVRRFLGLQRPAPQWSPRWGNYIFHTRHHAVEIAGQGMVRMTEHKFRFALSLFLHRHVDIPWHQLHRLAWGENGLPRAAAVAAHASWVSEVLELNGLHGYDLLATSTHYRLRRRLVMLRDMVAPDTPPFAQDDFADTAPDAL